MNIVCFREEDVFCLVRTKLSMQINRRAKTYV